MSVLACNLQSVGLNDQQELRKAAFKQVYGWIISPALRAQSLTHMLWCQELNDLHGRPPQCYEPDYYWERRPGGEEPWLAQHTDVFWESMWTNSISSRSSVATLPTEGRFPPGVFLQPDAKRLRPQ